MRLGCFRCCPLLLLCAGTLVPRRRRCPTCPRRGAGTQCVEDPVQMRRHHMELLKHQRDATVHGGIRGAKHSLKDCVACHATSPSRSVAAAPGDFCVACHQYAAVKIDCFECHTGKPATAVARGTP
jgi:hypothetical protein